MDFDFDQFLAAVAFFDAIGDFFGGIFSAIGDFFGRIFDAIGGFFSGIFDWLLEFIRGMGKWALWLCIALLIIAGFAGTIIPFLPGTTLILAGVCLHYFALGLNESGISVTTLVIIAILYVASVIVDNLSGAIGAKWFGSSKWGIIGAILGGLVGLSFSLPGIIIGPIIGVFVFEMIFGKKKIKEAGNSTVGTVVGSGAGLIAGAAIGLLMILCYVLDIFVWK
ncbi:MAG: DUF456 domain-containing protein [Verrucomicrobiales bacterium]|nr:DUF456 domain-containing protein [Verrucomicrobiales bacterium]